MSEGVSPQKPGRSGGTILIIGLFSVLVVAALAITLVALSAIPNQRALMTPIAPGGTPTFEPGVEAKVAQANPARGEMLFSLYGCSACHGSPDGVAAPYMKGIGTRAATRRSHYSAAAYIYESITTPNAFTVPGYGAGVMPQNFKQMIPEKDLFDLIAWLLTWK